MHTDVGNSLCVVTLALHGAAVEAGPASRVWGPKGYGVLLRATPQWSPHCPAEVSALTRLRRTDASWRRKLHPGLSLSCDTDGACDLAAFPPS